MEPITKKSGIKREKRMLRSTGKQGPIVIIIIIIINRFV